jgi:ABC-type multidrug transport system ATPase subunit
MDEAARCDRVALVQNGNLLAVDAPGNVGRRFPRPLFAVRAKERAALLTALRAFPHVASALPFGETVHFSDRRDAMAPEALIAELRAHLVAGGLHEVGIVPITPGIEDAFIELMGEPAAA